MPLLRRFLSSVMLAASLLTTGVSVGAETAVDRIEVHVIDGRLMIDADVSFDLTAPMRDAAERGLPINIAADLVVTHSRWWWFDRTDVDAQINWRIVFNALTRQWRVGTGQLTFPVASLDEALEFVRNVRKWDVGNVADFQKDVLYEGQLRVRVDSSLLPRPLQINALNSSDWQLATPWKPFTFSISTDQSVPP